MRCIFETAPKTSKYCHCASSKSLYKINLKYKISPCSKGYPPLPLPTYFFLPARASFLLIIKMLFPQHYPSACTGK